MMHISKPLVLGVLVLGIVVAGNGAAQAAFVEISDFNKLALGPINEQNGWHAQDPSSVVALDPALAGLHVLNVVTESTVIYHEAIIPVGETRMLFMRFRYEEQLSVSFGMTQNSAPDRFGEFDVELSLTSTRDDLRINDDGTYLVLTTLEPRQWYNCWIWIDNDANASSVWLHNRPNEGATAADQLEIDGRTVFPFRGSVIADLENFYIKTGGGDGISGPLIIDDIFLQNTDGVDLSYPASAASAVTPHSAQMHLNGAWPNPFNPTTTISFSLETEVAVRLSVFDISGRRVRSLILNEIMAAGAHEVAWDGVDDAGHKSATGVYLYSLEAGGIRQTKSMTLIK